MFIYLKASPV